MINYQIVYSRRKTLALQINSKGELLVKAPLFTSRKIIEDFIIRKKDWILKQQARRENRIKLNDEDIRKLTKAAKIYIPEKAAYYSKIMGVSYNRISIRHQKSRWGSCSGKGNLNFNCLLMLTPEAIRDSVIVHELAHLIEMNHSPRFYQIVRSVYPQYDNCHKWLKENGIKIIQD